MADDTHDIAAGPSSTDPPPAARSGPGGSAASGRPVAAPTFAEYARRIGAGIEVVGRSRDTAAGDEPGRVAEPALVGAPAGIGGGVVAAAVVDDTPRWSFQEVPRPRSHPGAEMSPPDRSQVELPFPPAQELVSPAPRPQPMFGPVAQSRSTLLVPLLAVISLGAYALVWHHNVNRELEEFDPKLHARPSRSTLAVAVPWLLGLLVTVAGAAFLLGTRLSIHLPLASHVSTAQATYLLAGLLLVPYLTLILPFSLVAVVMTLERLRCVEEHVGVTTDRQVRPVRHATLLAIPVVGGLVLLSTVQGRVNASWDAVAPAGRQLH
jgi:hypothetical protein